MTADEVTVKVGDTVRMKIADQHGNDLGEAIAEVISVNPLTVLMPPGLLGDRQSAG